MDRRPAPANLMQFIHAEEQRGVAWASAEGRSDDCRAEAGDLYIRLIRDFGPAAQA